MTNSIPPEIKPLQPYYSEPETDLVDLWIVLRRRQKVLYAALLLAGLVALALINLVAPIYESRAVIQVGHLSGNIAVEPAVVLVERLTERYRVKDGSEGPQLLPQLTAIKVNKGVPDAVTLIARGDTAEQAQLYLRAVLADLQAEHDTIYQETIRQQRERASQIESRIAMLQRHQQELGDSAALKTIDPTQRVLLLQDRSKVLQELHGFEQELAGLKMGMSKIQTMATRTLREPTLPVRPLQPRPLLYLALALAGGMILGVIGVFLVEYLSQARQRLRATADL